MASLVVDTVYGKVQGTQQDEVNVWKGVPYAKAPSGELRFQRPQPPERWTGVHDATQFGPACVQVTNPLNPKERLPQSEDCLSLNIWSPGADNKGRPVMVWIHGGSFVFGTGQTPWYDGTSFARSGGVVVVTINYRLGPLGFLYLGDVAGTDYEVSGNCGLLDQVAALEWVQENISAFGGDPNRVTVFGESAGSMSVGSLMVMPEAKGLFQQAIMESGLPWPMRTREEAAETTRQLLSKLGITTTDRQEVLKQVSQLSAETLVEASTQVTGGPRLTWSPVVDGVSIPEPFMEALEKGAAKDIPIIVGNNLNEMALWTGRDPAWRDTSGDEAVLRMFEQRWGQLPSDIARFYLEGKTGHELKQALVQLGSYRVFGAGIQKLANRQVGQGPMFVYRFDWPSPVAGGRLGACHALEIPFVFNTIDLPSSQVFTGAGDNRQQVANQMHQAWIRFAHTGNPNTPGNSDWPAYNLKERPTMVFHVQSRTENDPYGQERVVWEKQLGL